MKEEKKAEEVIKEIEEKYLKKMQNEWLRWEENKKEDKESLHIHLDDILLDALRAAGLKKLSDFYKKCDDLTDGFWHA